MSDQSKLTIDANSCCEIRSSVRASPSCLRNERKNTGITRNVSFPDDDSQIVTGILEPENPWKSVTDITNEDLVTRYIDSCKKHGTHPIPVVLEQLSKFELKLERNKLFSLKSVTLNPVICETLEEILKHIQFNQINFESTSLDDEASVALFDMLEYYESATHLNISSNPNIGIRGWQACARMIKKAYSLVELEARNTTLNEQSMPILGRALKVGSQLQVLKLENCNLSGRAIIILVSAMKMNTNLKELYLCENNLGMNDANQLGSMLKCNTTLQLLDISNNDIKDVGFNYIVDGIVEQRYGLSVLMVWNNQLTRNIAYTVVRLLEELTSLETLNIGQNAVGDDFVQMIAEPLISNKNLLRLGLQSTSLSNEAAFVLSDILRTNNLIQRIDLRDNGIQSTGLTALLESLESNTSVIRLDLDRIPRKCAFAETTATKYKSLVDKIRARCAENEKNIMERKNEQDSDSNEEEDSVRELITRGRNLKLSVVDTRKISLTCDSLQLQPQDLQSLQANSNNYLGEPKKNGRLRSPAPSPIPSPVSSPSPVRNRFQVSRVAENSPSPSPSPPLYVPTLGKTSRFKVTIVEPEIEDSIDDDDDDDRTSDDGSRVHKDLDDENKENEPSRSTGQEDKFESDLKDSSKISEKIRKLPWVSPILQTPAIAAIESAKMPANLEKLFGLFQSPFSRQNKTEGGQSGEVQQRHEMDKNDHETCAVGKQEVTRSGPETVFSEEVQSKGFPATWPQKLTPNFLSSPSKSSPNMFVLLQNHLPSDLTGFQNTLSVQTESPTGEPTHSV